VRTVATAGHVDHGKSSLVRALTGTDPDRFAEEKARGLTIDLGYAFTTLPSGEEVGFVDVPGHVRFIKNMLAGVGALEVVMLVVAANEGWMPQSEEHLRIVELLGVNHGFVVLTKADTVDTEMIELAHLELDDHLAESPLAGAPVVVCDSLSGRGLDDVRAALDTVLGTAPAPRDVGRPRLWIDRVFSARGAGTVVTGTLTGGALAVDDTVEVGPDARHARVRGIERAHRTVELAAPGTRVALNLTGIHASGIERGHAAVLPGQWAPTTAVDVALTPLDGVRFAKRATLHCHVGSGEHRATCRVLDDDRRFGRLRLHEPVPLVPGDRLVLRDPGRSRTLGGAEVLDVAPTARAAAAPGRLALGLGPRLLAGGRWARRDELGPRAGVGPGETDGFERGLLADGAVMRLGEWLVERATVAGTLDTARERVGALHRDRPLEPGIELGALARALQLDPARLRAALGTADDILVERGLVRLATHRDGVAGTAEATRVIDALAARPFSPPDPHETASADVVRALVREGVLVDLDGVVFAASALDQAREQVRRTLAERGSLTVADARDLLGSTRKYVLPILNRLDAEGVTRRRGDARVAGPA